MNVAPCAAFLRSTMVHGAQRLHLASADSAHRTRNANVQKAALYILLTSHFAKHRIKGTRSPSEKRPGPL